MMRPSITPLLLGLLAAPGCSGDDGASGNPKVLWLAPLNRSETQVKLTDTEPPPY